MKILKYVCAIMAMLVLLTSCGTKATENSAERIREKYKDLESIKLSADITADFGDRVGTYSITYELSGGTGVITIEKPAEIAGITAKITAGSSTLEYDGLILETGKLAGTALTPIDAVPTMLDTWAGGYMTDMGTERRDGVKCIRLTYSQTIDESAVEQQAWFDAETLAPVRAETLIDGKLVITCEFTEQS